jgi:hypothetical protein
MFIFPSTSLPVGAALVLLLSLHNGQSCEVLVQNNIPGVGIQVTTFNGDDLACDDYYHQYDVAAGQGKVSSCCGARDFFQLDVAARKVEASRLTNQICYPLSDR